MTKLLFKLEYTVRELRLPSDVALTFEYDGPHDTKVVVRPPSDEEQASGHSEQHAFCTASSVAEPNNRVGAVFVKIAADDILPQGGSGEVSTEYSTPDGTRVRIPTLSHFPEYFCSFVNNVSGELRDLAVRTISVLRCRSTELGPHNPISSRGLHWSSDGAFWHPMPADFGVRVETLGKLRPTEQMRTEVDQIVRSGGGAPLHHDLFREAWQQRHENPRSSLVTGMAAAELSLKHCISTLVPNAEWLATNLPTPPLVQMLIEYLPKLPAKCDIGGQVKPPPQAVLDNLKKGVTMRNQLSHASASSPSGDKVETILLSVHDLLWLLDYYTGYEWALDFLRPETRETLTAA